MFKCTKGFKVFSPSFKNSRAFKIVAAHGGIVGDWPAGRGEVWRWMVWEKQWGSISRSRQLYQSSPYLSSELSLGLFVGSPSRTVRIMVPTSLKPDPVELFISSASRFSGGAPPWTLE